jgi:hypothetical protein
VALVICPQFFLRLFHIHIFGLGSDHMSILIDKAGFAARICQRLMKHAAIDGAEIDGMRLLQVLAGLTVETLLLFDDADEGLAATYRQLSILLNCEPMAGALAENALPPSHQLDAETEQGRALARRLFEDWLNCAYEFHDIVTFIVHNVICRMEAEGQPRAELLRLFIEITNRCMAYEIAAQELCDIVIDEKVSIDNWSLCECVSGLSAAAGRCLALSVNTGALFGVGKHPDHLDQVAYVMTQEAIRLGIPAGTDWRFGLAANDHPCTAPYDLIFGLEPACQGFFKALGLDSYFDQSVALAKAAGRMLALAAGGESPEIEPVIAKPLAMAAMTDTYRTVRREAAVAL